MAIEKMRLFLGPGEEYKEENARAKEIVRELGEIEGIEINGVIETKGTPLFEENWPYRFPTLSMAGPENAGSISNVGIASGIESIEKTLKLRKVVSVEENVTRELEDGEMVRGDVAHFDLKKAEEGVLYRFTLRGRKFALEKLPDGSIKYHRLIEQ